MIFELAHPQGIIIPGITQSIQLGMNFDTVKQILAGQTFLHGKTILKYPEKKTVVEEDYQYPDLGNLRLRYIDNRIVSIIVRKNTNKLLYNNKDLFDIPFNNIEHDFESDVIKTKDKIFVSKYNLAFILFDDVLSTILIETKDYYTQTQNDLLCYYAKMTRDKDDNVVIRFTNR